MALSKRNLLPQTLISFIALFLMLLVNKVHSQDSTAFQFDSFDSDPTDLTYQGDAHVPLGSSFLRLTGTNESGFPESWSTGRVLYSHPVQFWETGRQTNFETIFRFQITPAENGAADGIAFFIAPVGSTIPDGSAGANLGIFNASGSSANLFAVEFDTYAGGDWDPSYRHIGIDINSRNSANVTSFVGALGQEVTAHITYEVATRVISVVANTETETFELSYVFDLKTILPEQVQVGISSSTGANVDQLGIHDIFSWSFTSNLVNDEDQANNN